MAWGYPGGDAAPERLERPDFVFLREQLFSAGTSLSSEDVAQRLGFARRVDFEAAAARARRLVGEADALEKAK